jgi:hypothetical protein
MQAILLVGYRKTIVAKDNQLDRLQTKRKRFAAEMAE